MNCTCNNCDWTGPESALACDFEHIPDLVDRIDAGGEVPAGECPECGALAYLVKDTAPTPSPLVPPGERAGERGAAQYWLLSHSHRHGQSNYLFPEKITEAQAIAFLGDDWEPDRDEFISIEPISLAEPATTTAGETPAAPSPRVVIIVAGGVVTDVLCSDATTRVELLDHDNAETKAERDTLCLREAEAEAALHHVPIH